MDGTTSSATMVPLGALRWYRLHRYSGTAYSAMMVPLRRYYHLIVSAIVFAPLFSLRNLVMEGDSTMQQTVGTVFDMWQKLAFTFVQVKFCEWWFRTHRQGPLENLWHKWTWGTN